MRLWKTGVRISFQGNVLTCNRRRTRNENLEVLQKALQMLLGFDPWKKIPGSKCAFETFGGKIEYYAEG